ncbi:MAG: bifunctional alpha,alpha-trehalose-phosphate synthase (UDP-forming)/trehalose-phosphatase [Polyangiales bacterium]
MPSDDRLEANAAASARVLIVSNRLPVTAARGGDGFAFEPSSGGLATALASVTGRRETLWIGWPGVAMDQNDPDLATIDGELARRRLAPVHLTRDEIALYYDGFANGVLWPLFHYLVDKVSLEVPDQWGAYATVNRRFADVVASHARAGDVVWVHDYQLALVPALLRARAPGVRIGFFLHIPFPSEDVFRILPWREEILRGLLGADLIGFHTAADMNHFVGAAAQVLGIEPGWDALFFEGRVVRIGAYPISVDAEALSASARSDRVRDETARVRESAGSRVILLGVDRLDYTKGIRFRLRAFARLLERDPTLRDRVRYIQVAVPSRDAVPAYVELSEAVHALVGRINGQHGSIEHTPIVFLNRAMTSEQVAALYAAADVMLVTPLRDGMNLVAKEFVACKNDESGVLVLSEFAGAAAELSEALIVNPYDIEGTSRAIERAIGMGEIERHVRMRAMRRRVFTHDVHGWCASFLADVEIGGNDLPTLRTSAPPPNVVASLVESPSLCLVLDYDGTLVPLLRVPALAIPDDRLLTLLQKLVARPRTDVHLVSGRRREDLERWFGATSMHLHAEHGFWSRSGPSAEWEPAKVISADWKAIVNALFDRATRRTIGSFVEEKTSCVAWHYRNADPELAAARVRELRAKLSELARNGTIDLLDGSKVLEVRAPGIDKGLAAARIAREVATETAIVAIGDDHTDEEMFRALPDSAITIHVGPDHLGIDVVSTADFRVPDSTAARELLESLVR